MATKRGMIGMDKKMQAECDLHTLMRAAEIKADPGRMKAAKMAAENQAKEAAKVAKSMKGGKK